MSRSRDRKMGVLIRGKHRCHYCGAALTIDTVTIDHVKPKSRGGNTTVGNLVAACQICNQAKADRSYAEFVTKGHVIERVAVAIHMSVADHVAWDNLSGIEQFHYREMALAALAAMDDTP